MISRIKRSFRLRLTLIVLLVVLIPMVGTIIYITFTGIQNIQESAKNAIRAEADILTQTVTAWDNTMVLAMKNLSQQPGIVSMDPAQQKPILVNMADVYTDVYLIHTVNPNGDNVARSDNEEFRNYADREWFKSSMAGKELTRQSLIGRTTGEPAITYGSPIREANVRIVGVALAATDLGKLGEAVGAVAIGETGFGYLIDENGVILAHPDPAYTTGELASLSAYPPVTQVMAGKQGDWTFTDSNGAVWFSYLQPLDNGWSIVVQQERTEAMAALTPFVFSAVGLGSLVLLIIGALIWVVAGQVVKPIETLTVAATAVAGGDLDEPVNITRSDEIGVLAAAFNSMTLQLKGLVGNLETRVSARTRDLALASEVGRSISEIHNVDDLLTSAVSIIQAHFGLYFVQIYLVDDSGKQLILKAAEGQAAERLLKLGHYLDINAYSINGKAAVEMRPILVPHTVDDPVFRPNPLLPETRSEIAVPLISVNKVVGVLDIQSTEPYAFSEENMLAFQSLAGQLSITMQNAALFTEREETYQTLQNTVMRAETQAARFAALNVLSAEFTAAQNLDDVLHIASDNILTLVDGDRASIAFVSENGDSFEVLALEGEKGALQTGMAMPLTGTAVGTAVTEKRIVQLPKDAPLSTYADSRMLAKQGLQSLMVAPLSVGEQIIGSINIGSKEPYAFDEADVNFIQQIATLLAASIESLRLGIRIQTLAAIVESHPDFIGVGTLDGEARYVNPAGLAMVGLPKNYDVSTMSATDFYTTEDAKILLNEGIPQALASGSWTSEAHLQRIDGSIIPVEQTIAINYDAQNNPTGFSITMRDITERVRTVEDQRRLTTQLEERLLQVNTLQRAMTHEGWTAFLSSPSRLIQGYKYHNEQIGFISTRDVEQGNVPAVIDVDGSQIEQPDPATIAAPVKVGGETIGVIGARNPDGKPLNEDQLAILNALTQQVADALDRSRLFEEMEMAREQMNALLTGSERVVRATSINAVLLALVESTELKRMDTVNFLFFNKPWDERIPDTMTITAVWERISGFTPEKAGDSYNITQFPSLQNVSKDKPTIFQDVRTDDRAQADAKMLADKLGVTCVMYFPLIVGNQWLGLLSAKAKNSIKFTDNEIKQITGLVDQAASVSQTQRLFEVTQARARREQILREVTARVYAAPDAETIMKTAAREVNRVLGVDSFIYLDKPQEIQPENGRQPILENGIGQEG